MNQLLLLFRLENSIFFIPDFLRLIHCDLRIHSVQSFLDFFQMLILTVQACFKRWPVLERESLVVFYVCGELGLF
jgi:hypothetical protein